MFWYLLIHHNNLTGISKSSTDFLLVHIFDVICTWGPKHPRQLELTLGQQHQGVLRVSLTLLHVIRRRVSVIPPPSPREVLRDCTTQEDFSGSSSAFTPLHWMELLCPWALLWQRLSGAFQWGHSVGWKRWSASSSVYWPKAFQISALFQSREPCMGIPSTPGKCAMVVHKFSIVNNSFSWLPVQSLKSSVQTKACRIKSHSDESRTTRLPFWMHS